jgi:aspartate/methionine/tyrosine aminotransferase
MILDYLSWYKDLEVRLQGIPDAHLLMASSVREPTDIMREHLDQFLQKELSAMLSLSNAWGYPPLTEAVARRYGVDPTNIATTNGVSNAIYLLCRLLLSRGDHVLIESPVYEPLTAAPDFIGCEVGYLGRKQPDYLIDPDDLRVLLRPNTRLLIISNLHNPSGAMLSDSLLMELATQAARISPNIMIVVDEVYRDFVSSTTVPSATLDGRFISLNSLTKSYGLGSLHTGWIIAKPDMINSIKRLQTLVEGSGATLLEAFVSYVVDNLQEYRDFTAKVMSQNRRLLHEQMEPLLSNGILSGAIPEHGCIYFPRVNAVDSTDALVEDLAEKQNVYVVPGRFFGEPANIRIGIGGEIEKLEEALAAFVRAMT